MAEFKVGDEGIYQGRVVDTKEVDLVLLESGAGRRIWLDAADLTHAPAPVTVECEWGYPHLLKDLPTLRERCKALGMGVWSTETLEYFVEICARLAEKGVTAEQFVEGL